MKRRFEKRQDVAYERQTDRILARRWDNAAARLAMLTAPVWSVTWCNAWPHLAKSSSSFAALSPDEQRSVVERRSRERRR